MSPYDYEQVVTWAKYLAYTLLTLLGVLTATIIYLIYIW